jgi:type IV secretory pathway VirJ component
MRSPAALQDDLAPQEAQTQPLEEGLTPHTLQDVFVMQPAILVSLIAQLTGFSLQDDIAMTARRLQQQLPENLSRKGCAPIIEESREARWSADIFVVFYSGDPPHADPQTALSR